MKRILLTQGKETIVDDKDYGWLSKNKWHAVKGCGSMWYASRRKDHKSIRMHRVITQAIEGELVDHINRDGLDNRRANLRLCSHAENIRNRPATSKNSSGFKGVYWSKQREKWKAVVCFEKKAYQIGYFSDKMEAARAYDEKARALHGDFACVNFQLAE
jgi:hypothetical protein